MKTENLEDMPNDHPREVVGECCQSLSTNVREKVAETKEYMRKNPVPVVLGALAFGAVVGYLLVLAKREEPTFRERFVDDPLLTSRDALYAALAPIALRLHEGYDSARDGAENAMSKLHRRNADSWSDKIGRVSSNLKFW